MDVPVKEYIPHDWNIGNAMMTAATTPANDNIFLFIMTSAFFETLKGHFRQSGRINQLRDELRVQMAADFIVGIRPAAEENK